MFVCVWVGVFVCVFVRVFVCVFVNSCQDLFASWTACCIEPGYRGGTLTLVSNLYPAGLLKLPLIEQEQRHCSGNVSPNHDSVFNAYYDKGNHIRHRTLLSYNV